mgnify:CR=1 FL=1
MSDEVGDFFSEVCNVSGGVWWYMVWSLIGFVYFDVSTAPRYSKLESLVDSIGLMHMSLLWMTARPPPLRVMQLV